MAPGEYNIDYKCRQGDNAKDLLSHFGSLILPRQIIVIEGLKTDYMTGELVRMEVRYK